MTGRINRLNVYPLSFKEYLRFKSARVSPIENYRQTSLFESYLNQGGYPEFVLNPQDRAYFSDLIDNIIYKDIVSVYQLRNPQVVKELLLLLADRVGHHTTYTRLAQILAIDVDTVKEYLFYLKNTFLIFEVTKFGYARGPKIYGPKKFYFWDNGLWLSLIGRRPLGPSLEQVVAQKLARDQVEFGFYYQDKKELDFIYLTKNRKQHLLEVKYQVSSPEFDLVEYLRLAKKLEAKKLQVVTFDQGWQGAVDNIDLELVPGYRWV